MSRSFLVLANPEIRKRAHAWIEQAPNKTRVEFKSPKRTNDQNALLWSCLGDIAKQVKYHDLTLTPEDFKILFLDALHRETRMVPNLDNTGFVALGRSSSDLSVGEFSELIELIMEWGARHSVVFHDRGFGCPV
jgi:hypothetical protein